MNSIKTADELTVMFHALSQTEDAPPPAENKALEKLKEQHVGAKKNFSAFLRGMFPMVTPQTVAQIRDMIKYFREEEIMGAIAHYYRSRDEPAPDIEDWVGYSGYDKLKSAIEVWHMVLEANEFNSKAKLKKEDNPGPITYALPDRYCRTEIDEFWENPTIMKSEKQGENQYE